MVKDNIRKIACLGAGTIGASWATYYLWKGLEVNVQDTSQEALYKAQARIKANLTFLLNEGLMNNEEYQNASNKVFYTTSIAEAVSQVSFIQESTFESYEVKKIVLEEVDRYAPEAIFASSTSGLLISEIQKHSKYPERCITAHPFNPPHLVPLVELVKGELTSEDTIKDAYNFYLSIGKMPILVNKEVPGHIANRIQHALWRECIDLVMNGVCSVQDVDRACSYGPGLRWSLMGPNMIFHLGGGEKGIRGIIDHIGPSIESWWEDMATWKSFPEGCKDILESGVIEEIADKTPEEVAAWRDKQIVSILKGLNRI